MQDQAFRARCVAPRCRERGKTATLTERRKRYDEQNARPVLVHGQDSFDLTLNEYLADPGVPLATMERGARMAICREFNRAIPEYAASGRWVMDDFSVVHENDQWRVTVREDAYCLPRADKRPVGATGGLTTSPGCRIIRHPFSVSLHTRKDFAMQTQHLTLYHGTPHAFDAFDETRPAFFFEDARQCSAILKNIRANGDAARSITCAFNGTVADEQEALAVWNRAFPTARQERYLYSMLCKSTGEFLASDIDCFVGQLRDEGIQAVRGWDYDQTNMETGPGTTSVAVIDHSALTIVSAGKLVPRYVRPTSAQTLESEVLDRESVRIVVRATNGCVNGSYDAVRAGDHMTVEDFLVHRIRPLLGGDVEVVVVRGDGATAPMHVSLGTVRASYRV